MSPAHLVAVTEWLVWVAHGTGMPSAADADAKLKTMAVMMGEKYPDTRMFCSPSATFVAHECGLMSLPSVGILGKFLEKWWQANKSAHAALPAPGAAELANAPLSGTDRAAAQVWLNHHHAALLSDHTMTMRLAVIRQCNEAGYRWLIANNDRAKDLAYAQGWLRQTNDPFDDPGPILASVRSIVDPPHPRANVLLSALRAGVERDAPEYADLVPHTLAEHFGEDEPYAPIPSQAAMVRADDGVVRVDRPALAESTPPPTKPFRQLSPEHLAAARENNPLLKAVAARQAAIEAERKLHEDDSARYAIDHAPPDSDELLPDDRWDVETPPRPNRGAIDNGHTCNTSALQVPPRPALKPLVWEDVP